MVTHWKSPFDQEETRVGKLISTPVKRSKLCTLLSFFSDFITYNVDTHEISFINDGSKKDSDQGNGNIILL